jgi:hypothetical protein
MAGRRTFWVLTSSQPPSNWANINTFSTAYKHENTTHTDKILMHVTKIIISYLHQYYLIVNGAQGWRGK